MPGKQWDNICSSIDACALTGAAAFFAGIPDAEILANGQLWCYFYALRYLEHSAYDMAERFHCSQPDNNAVVYGTEKFLLETLARIQQSGRRPSVMLIENSCSISLIGDDLAGIARKASLDFPVVTMDCGGLTGGFAEGYVKACLNLLQTLPPANRKTVKGTINILGLTDFYFNGLPDREEILRILRQAGYKIAAVPGSGSTLNDIASIAKAQLNIVINEELGLPVAKYLKRRYDIPYIVAGMPYGIDGTKSWLQKIGQVIPAYTKDIFAECDNVKKLLTAYSNDLRCSWGRLWFDNVLICAPGTTALCLADAVRNEWLDTHCLQLVCRNKIETASLYPVTADKIYQAEEHYDIISSLLQTSDKLLLIGSSNESSILIQHGKNFACCNIAYPVNDEILLTRVPFAGIKGSIHMMQRLWNAFIQNTKEENICRS